MKDEMEPVSAYWLYLSWGCTRAPLPMLVHLQNKCFGEPSVDRVCLSARTNRARIIVKDPDLCIHWFNPAFKITCALYVYPSAKFTTFDICSVG